MVETGVRIMANRVVLGSNGHRRALAVLPTQRRVGEKTQLRVGVRVPATGRQNHVPGRHVQSGVQRSVLLLRDADKARHGQRSERQLLVNTRPIRARLESTMDFTFAYIIYPLFILGYSGSHKSGVRHTSLNSYYRH